MDLPATPKANGILAALPATVYRRLLRDLEPTTLQVGDTLFRPAGRLQYAHFPISGIVTSSYPTGKDEVMPEAWPVGNEGMVGISLFLGGRRRDNRADVQIGGIAYRIPASALMAEFRRTDAFQQLLLRYVFALVTQASQLGLCNSRHPIEQRLCRFLSRVFDRVAGNEVALTQERIAALLDVRRVSITNAAVQLHTAGIIEYRRGRVRLLNRKRLDEQTCPCAGIIKRAFEAVSK